MEVLQQNIDVLLHLLLDCLAVHGHDEGVDVAEGDEDDGGADGGSLQFPQGEGPCRGLLRAL